MSPWGGCPGPQSAWILHPTASLPPAGSRARPAVPSSGATVAPGPPGVFGPECQSTGPLRVSTDLLQSLSLGIFRAPFRGSNAAPRQPGWHKASSPAFVYTGHDSRETNPRRAGQEYQGHFRDIHRTRNHSYALSAWIPHVGPSLQSGFSGRCDAQGRDSSPHAGDRKRTPPPPPSLQYPTSSGDPRAKAGWCGSVD